MNFTLTPGSYLQLTGANGSGKTSLLRILCRLLHQSEGEIRWQDVDIRSLGEDYFSQITYLGHRHASKGELTAAENLRISAGLSGLQIDGSKIADALRKVGLGERMSLATRLLSEGQRRRVSLARLLIGQAKLWLLDEILTSLDKSSVSLVRSLIEEHLANGGMVIVATHQELDLNVGQFQRLELAT